jgi:hypothetical protein
MQHVKQVRACIPRIPKTGPGYLGRCYALFSAATALLAKVGVSGVDSDADSCVYVGIALGLEHHGLSEIGRRS